ncbi:hypothetical protein F2P81_026295 [Scophthalmus maximus]|uniref:Uncharacterized protein n=1 Tax=Scophthalmus maximus TaxID=52904 RepID=A0A6A4RQZ7_SCOMX|nr:hypothetical protein F2P81_026295 [Scophthalmus maximus]
MLCSTAVLCPRRSLYNEPLTPSSNPSLSPGGSPLREAPLDRSALPSPADWSEFIGASNSKVERDLAQLTLSDPEQRELYEAARLVQTAFRKYKVQARVPYAECTAAHRGRDGRDGGGVLKGPEPLIVAGSILVVILVFITSGVF